MLKTKQSILHISIFAAIIMLVSACGAGNIIKPIRSDIIGQATVRNVTVVATGTAKSAKISNRVKAAVEKEAKDELKGNKQVDLRVTIDRWAGVDSVMGGKVTSKLFGSKTTLTGMIDVLDTNTGETIGKYTIFSEYKEGGLLGASMTTISFTNTDQYVIDMFATLTINTIQ